MIDTCETAYTVGHSRHSIDAFLGLLARHRIGAVADVRSVPFSRRNPHFSRKPLSRSLERADVRYVHLGKELGGRSDDPGCYEDGRVLYDRVARTGSFLRGMERLEQGMGKYRVAVMCAEGEPLDCHRTLLVAPAIRERGHQVTHILPDGAIETHERTMDRLLDRLGVRPVGMLALRPRAEVIAEAVALQSRRVAYRAEGPAKAGGRQ